MTIARHGIPARARPRSFRWRMIRVVSLLLATMFVPMGFLVAGDLGDYRDAEETVGTVTTVQDVQALIHELQKERGLTLGLLGGDSRFREQLSGQRALTDHALDSLRRQVDQGMRRGSTVRSALAPLGTLGNERSAVDHGATDRSSALHYYTDSIASLANLDLGTGSTSDPALRRGLEALQALGDAKEFTGRERAVLSGVFAARRIDQADYLVLLDDLAGKKAMLAVFAKTATPAEQARLTAVQASSAARQAADDESVAVASAGTTLSRYVDPVAWFTTMTTYIDSLRQVQIGIGADVDARAAALRSAAGRRLAGLGLLLVLAAGFEVWLAVRALRSVVGPLARLARDAQDLAERRLPEAVHRLRTAVPEPDDRPPAARPPMEVPAYAGSEIVDLAAAIGLVHDSALTLATGQAVLRRNVGDSLLNLARRNQNLVRRQLAFITLLENDEADPDALGRLFELDHLATRMRRNAESLLVLIGEATPRPRTEPLSASDLIRAAMSEVEDYPRVAIEQVDAVSVDGAVVADLAHLLAELIENALNFSPPDTEVLVTGQTTGEGYLITVADRGVGMSAGALARANAKLRGDEHFEVAPTRFLGHYVVGRLAERIGARVGLSGAPGAGTTARIELPAGLIHRPGPVSAPASAPAPAGPMWPVARPQSDGAVEWPSRDGGTVPGSVPAAAPAPAPAPSHPATPPSPYRPAPASAGTLLTAFSAGYRQGMAVAVSSPQPEDAP